MVGPSHVAFLLEDGRVCRVQYYVSEEYQTKSSTSTNETSKESSRKSGQSHGQKSTNLSKPLVNSKDRLGKCYRGVLYGNVLYME